jgi:PAS domain S-box-containing protein
MASASTPYVRSGIVVVIVMAAALLSATPRLQWAALGVVLGGTALLGWQVVRQARDAAVCRGRSDELRRLNADLEAQVQAGAADARSSSERLRTIIDSAVDGIVVIDPQGRIESFNPAAERLFEYPQAEVVGRNVSMLMPSPYREEHDGYLSRYLTTGKARIIGIGREVTGRRRDGTTFPLRLSVGEMTVGAERRFTGIMNDLSDRVRHEQQLREGAAVA